jgi:glutaredoxin-related protein
MLKKLINQAPVMLFMKGNAENPQCGNNSWNPTKVVLLCVTSFFYYQDSADKL